MVSTIKIKLGLPGILEKTYIYSLLIIFGGIVLHAPISVGLGVLWPHYGLLIKSWKEILMVFVGLIAIYLLYKRKQFYLLRDPILVVILVYGLLHLFLVIFSSNGFNSNEIMAGLAIDLRYVLFFGLSYLALKMYRKYYGLFIKVGVIGASIVLIFALLQVFILPHDILKYIGYSHDTISPFLTVDQNPNFIRINSTLRGPNPLGAYAIISLSLIVSAFIKRKIVNKKPLILLISLLFIGSLVSLWSSYSRSAFIGAIISVGLILWIVNFRKLSTKVWITIGILLVTVASAIFLARDTSFVSNVLLHDNPSDLNSVNSNEGHISSLRQGFELLLLQPMGAGIGSTGSASLYSNSPLIIENQYLFIAHETGWFGLILFISIFLTIMIKLWNRRKEWLALGVFVSGVGLAIVGLLLPVWADDTVAIIWWGLAGIVIGYNQKDKV